MKTKIKAIGFEIEGEYDSQFLELLRKYGEIKSDGSVHNCSSYGRYGEWCNNLYTKEFASSIIKDDKDQTALEKASTILKEYDLAYKRKQYHWNESSGFHVHVSFYPANPPEIMSSDFVRYFINRVKEHFPTEYGQRKSNRYCSTRRITDRTILDGCDRYKAVNIKPSLAKHGTIEFRIFPANNPKKMLKYLNFTIDSINRFVRIGTRKIIRLNTDRLLTNSEQVLVFHECTLRGTISEITAKIDRNKIRKIYRATI